jgi:hypothetical protein
MPSKPSFEMHLDKIQPQYVTTTYNGGTGCACGCAGTYADGSGAVATRRINVINKAIEDDTLTALQVCADGTIILEASTGQDRVTRVYVNGNQPNAKEAAA